MQVNKPKGWTGRRDRYTYVKEVGDKWTTVIHKAILTRTRTTKNWNLWYRGEHILTTKRLGPQQALDMANMIVKLRESADE